MSEAKEIEQALIELGNPEIASHSQRFFKTAPGEYGAGDKFLGIRVPVIRKEIRHYKETGIKTLSKLLDSQWHEVRLFALLALVARYRRADESKKASIFQLYLSKTDRINNWDLIDTSAPYIVGAWLWEKDNSILNDLAVSESLWERRIAIMATYYFIRQNSFSTTLRIADILLDDHEDLIHKAVGWMLREVGNRNRETEEKYLKARYRRMPRTMLRYAIEKFEPQIRMNYLKGLV